VCSIVSAIFAQLSGPRGTNGRARTQRGSLQGGALGSALCPRIEQTDSSAPAPTRRFDETYVRVAGQWTYLYRALDSHGNTIDFMPSPKRDLVAAKHFLQLALWRSAVRPRVINVDGHPAYAHAIAELKEAGELGARCRCRTAPYLNNYRGAGPSIHQEADLR
jgi:transposase-like protein